VSSCPDGNKETATKAPGHQGTPERAENFRLKKNLRNEGKWCNFIETNQSFKFWSRKYTRRLRPTPGW